MSTLAHRAETFVLTHAGPCLPVHVDQLAVQAGVELRASGQAGCVNLDQNLPPVITLATELAPSRHRFALAHALAHWQLGHGSRSCGPACFVEHVGEYEEDQANRFAMALLVPSSPLRSLALGTPATVADLARKFQVAVPVIEIRLRELGLVS